jgi:hypothetical protein
LPVTRWRPVLTALVDRVDGGVDQIDIHLRPLRLGVLLDAGGCESAANGDRGYTAGARQHALGRFEINQLSGDLCAVGIEALQAAC